MELREMIELAAERTGSMKELGARVGIAAQSLTDAKAGRRSLPTTACMHLADILGIDYRSVQAASDLVTEKDERKRAYLAPFAQRAAIVLMGAFTLFVNASDSQAAPRLEKGADGIHIMSTRRRKISEAIRAIFAPDFRASNRLM